MNMLSYIIENYYKKNLIIYDKLIFLCFKKKKEKINPFLCLESNFYVKNRKTNKTYKFFFFLRLLIKIILLKKNTNHRKRNFNYYLIFSNLLLKEYLVKFFCFFIKKNYIFINSFEKKIKALFGRFRKYNFKHKIKLSLTIKLVKLSMFLFQTLFDFIKIKNLKLIFQSRLVRFKRLNFINLLLYESFDFYQKIKNYKIFSNGVIFFYLTFNFFVLNYIEINKTIVNKLKKIKYIFEKLFVSVNEKLVKFLKLKKNKNLKITIFKKQNYDMSDFCLVSYNFLDLNFKKKKKEKYFCFNKVKFHSFPFLFDNYKIFSFKKKIDNRKNNKKQEKTLIFFRNEHFAAEKVLKKNYKKLNCLNNYLTNSNKIIYLKKDFKFSSFYFKKLLQVYLDFFLQKFNKVENSHFIYIQDSNLTFISLKKKEIIFIIADLVNFSFKKKFFIEFLSGIYFDILKLDKFWFVYGYKALYFLDNFIFQIISKKKSRKNCFINSWNLNEYKKKIYCKRLSNFYLEYLRYYFFLFNSFSIYKSIIYEKNFQNLFLLVNYYINSNFKNYSLTLFLHSKLLISLGQIGKARVFFNMGILFFRYKSSILLNLIYKFFFFFEIVYGNFFSIINLQKIKENIGLFYKIKFLRFSFF
nr:hypothetical protein CcurKRNrm2_p029 [Cryptomonas curvata]